GGPRTRARPRRAGRQGLGRPRTARGDARPEAGDVADERTGARVPRAQAGRAGRCGRGLGTARRRRPLRPCAPGRARGRGGGQPAAAARADRARRADVPQYGIPRAGGRRSHAPRGRSARRTAPGARTLVRDDGAVAALQLRRQGGAVRSSVAERPRLEEQLTLLELVDRVLNKGVVVTGDITLSVAGVDLVYVGLRVLLASASTLDRLAAERAA